MEELFIKVTGETMQEAEGVVENDNSSKEKSAQVMINVTENDYELTEGKPISAFKQLLILLCKRFRILRRRYIPYIVAVVFAIAGAGCAQLLIKSFNKPMKCPVPANLIYDYSYRNDFGTGYSTSYRYYGNDVSPLSTQIYVFGPRSKLNDERLNLMANVYGVNNTRSYSSYSRYGYNNGSQISEQLRLVDTYEEFRDAVRKDWNRQAERWTSSDMSYSPYTNIEGGVWMGDEKSKPTVLVSARRVDTANQMVNVGCNFSMAHGPNLTLSRCTAFCLAVFQSQHLTTHSPTRKSRI
jgi:hypothetical protein